MSRNLARKNSKSSTKPKKTASRIQPLTSGKGRVVIGYCHREYSSAFFHSSLRRIENHDPNVLETINIYSGPKIDEARNEIVKTFLTTRGTHLLMVDDDMILPVDTVSRLLSHRKDVISGLAFSGGVSGDVRPALRVVREVDGKPTIDIYWDYPRNALFEVDGAGAACLLMRREVLEFMLQARGENHPMPWFAHGAHNGVPIGEDVAFCLTAKKCGFEVWADSSVEVLHHKPHFVGENEYVLALSSERHPYYALREQVPAYQEIENGSPSVLAS